MNNNNIITSTSTCSSNKCELSVFSKYYLPFEIIHYIQEYTNINNLLITCKYFELFRFELFKRKLTGKASLNYYNDTNFRYSLLNKMKFPNK